MAVCVPARWKVTAVVAFCLAPVSIPGRTTAESPQAGGSTQRRVRALVISAGAFHDTHQSTVLVRAVSRAVPDELYVTEKVWPGVRPLATPVDYRDQREYPVVWVHESQGVRVFGTTLGPDVATWDHPDSQALLVRGFRWAINRN